jgi:hypothetical protein
LNKKSRKSVLGSLVKNNPIEDNDKKEMLEEIKSAKKNLRRMTIIKPENA